DEDTEAVVLEMGMSAFGEINYLVDIARPEVGVITNVGISHMEILGSREGILKAKLEITDFFGSDNLLIIYDDGDVLSRKSAAAKGSFRLQTAGSLPDADFAISNVTDRGADGIEYDLTYGGVKHHVSLPAPGVHNAGNATLALAAGLAMGVEIEKGIEGLQKLELTSGRLSIKEGSGVRVIDDTYNASPDSMKAGLSVLAATAGSRRVAILGDMYELGDDSESWHRQVGEAAAEKGIDLVVAIGENAKAIAEGAKGKKGAGEVVHFAEKAEFIENLNTYIKKGDVILVKASRGMHMEEIVKAITE
ncbi:MAG: UDP-N-acetylmuramoyl-tripeptide--D-alanyl-D-alanine ligase, partial [Firmicutes bacterium]|nr:UDP-N-acetylmuramoyl-tripeptide--D-alanyl-D-alanine ligase [Bacillota bacterium]